MSKIFAGLLLAGNLIVFSAHAEDVDVRQSTPDGEKTKVQMLDMNATPPKICQPGYHECPGRGWCCADGTQCLTSSPYCS